MTAEEEVEKVKGIIGNYNNIAFIIGNGINRYKEESSLSWDSLLLYLWQKYSGNQMNEVPDGISNTEFYDILELEYVKKISPEELAGKKLIDNKQIVPDIQKAVTESMNSWVAHDHHIKIISKIKELNAPVLTTNYDKTLSSSIGLEVYRMGKKNFSRKHPWSAYFSENKIQDPSKDFGVWHINGQIEYPQSIKLGLSQYMESTEKVRRMIHSSNLEDIRFFIGKDKLGWEGENTWLHIVFNNSLFIFGLALKEDETFLRWLLIQRAKYFILFPKRKKEGWYLTCEEEKISRGQELFLKKVGLDVISVRNWKNIYEDIWQ